MQRHHWLSKVVLETAIFVDQTCVRSKGHASLNFIEIFRNVIFLGG